MDSIKNIIPKLKAMSKGRKIVALVVAAVLITALAIGSIFLFGRGSVTEARETYMYSFDQLGARDEQIDPYMTVDGKLDEPVWDTVNFTSHSQDKLNFKVGTYFTDNGLYVALTATDEKIIWTAPYDFNHNSSFEVYIADVNAVNDPAGGNIESNSHHPIEIPSFFVDANNVKAFPGIPVYANGTRTDTQMTCELFLTWKDLGMAEKPEQIRIWTLYRHVESEGGEGAYIYNGGFYTDPHTFYSMNLFNAQGSISHSGTLKNTEDMTLGNSPLGTGATDRWDLSGDNSEAEIRTAYSNASYSQVVYLKEQTAKNFEFEATLQFQDDGMSKERKAGIVIADAEQNRRIYVTSPGSTDFRLGQLLHTMYWINSAGTVATGAGSPDDTVTLKVIRYHDYLYYFYRYPGEEVFTFAYSELYEPMQGDTCTVGLYASSNTRFSDWKLTSFDYNPDSLREVLSQFTYFNELTYDESRGTAEISTTALKKGDSLTLTAIANAGYYLEKIEVNGVDMTAAFSANAAEGKYTFTPNEDVSVQVTFSEFTQEQKASLRRTYIIMTRADDAVAGGATVSAYPVTVTGSGYKLNEKSSVFYYNATTSSAGYATFELPYEGSALYSEGTYLIKVTNNAFFHYETVVTVKPQGEGDEKIQEIPVKIPGELTIQGAEDVVWTIDDNQTITALPSALGDGYSIAYFQETLYNGQISAEFTTACTGGVYSGFGYRMTSGDNIGSVGIIGVSYNGQEFEAVTYDYYGSYGGISIPLNQNVKLSDLVARGDVMRNSDGSITFTLRLVRAETDIYLFVGDTHVHTFRYGNGIQMTASHEIQLGLMFRSAWSFEEGYDRLYTVKKLQKPVIWNKTDRQTTVCGTVSGNSRENMTVVLKGTDIFGIAQQREISVSVSSEGKYSFTVGDLGENASDYILEFYQGSNVLRSIDGKPITLSLKANEAVSYDVRFNELKAEYGVTLELEGIPNALKQTNMAVIGSQVSVPEVYTHGSTMYVLDKTAQNNVLSGTVTADGKLKLSAAYKVGFAYSTNTRFEAGADENGLTLTSPTTANDKYILSKDAGNAFEVTATFSGVESAWELGSGFLVSDGQKHISFMWMGWSGGLQARDHWSVLYKYQGFGSAPNKYDPVTNNKITLKMAYSNRTFRFYLVNKGMETLISVFSLDQYSDFDAGGWTADTKLKVGFFSWNNAVSAVEVSNIDVKWLDVVKYDKEIYLPNGELVEIQKLAGEVGSQVDINSIYDLDGSLYIVDGSAPEDVASGTLQKGEKLTLSGTLNNKVFEYGTSTGNIAFHVSENNNLLLDIDGGTEMYMYSAYMGSRFDIKARFTSTSENCEVGFSVMDAKGNKLTFRLVAWNDYLAIIPDYDWSRVTFLDVGAGKVTKGRAVTLSMSYDHGTFTFRYNGKVTTYTNEDFEDDLYVGFLSYNDSSSGAEVELLDFSMPYPKPKN